MRPDELRSEVETVPNRVTLIAPELGELLGLDELMLKESNVAARLRVDKRPGLCEEMMPKPGVLPDPTFPRTDELEVQAVARQEVWLAAILPVKSV